MVTESELLILELEFIGPFLEPVKAKCRMRIEDGYIFGNIDKVKAEANHNPSMFAQSRLTNVQPTSAQQYLVDVFSNDSFSEGSLKRLGGLLEIETDGMLKVWWDKDKKDPFPNVGVVGFGETNFGFKL